MIDIKKKYKTRDGHKVRIYSTDGGGEYPVHGAYFEGGEWNVDTWHSSGKYHEEGDTIYDLIEINEKQELIEEALKRYPKGTIFLTPNYKTRVVSDGIVNDCHYSDNVLYVNRHIVYDNGKWAEIVKEHTVDLFVYQGTVDISIHTHKQLGMNSSLIAKKTITFYEGEGLN